MRIAYAFPLALSLVLPLRAQVPTAPPQYGTLDLTFVDSVTGNAVTAAKATIEQVSITQKGAKFTATSDAQGHAVFKNLPPGTYGVAGVETPGYAPVSPYPTIPIPQTAVNPLENARGPKVTLDRVGSIEGRIFDANGEPVPHILVDAYSDLLRVGGRGFGGGNFGETNDLGEYRIADLRPGRYFVIVNTGILNQRTLLSASRTKQASTRPSGYANAAYPNGNDITQAQVLNLDPGGALVDVDLRLKKTPLFRVEGQVFGSNPNISRPEVALQPCAADGYLGSWSTTPYMMPLAKDGKFSFRGVTAGTYCVTYQESEAGARSGHPQSYARELVTVGPDQDMTDLKLTMTPPGNIEGTVRLDGKPTAKQYFISLDPSSTLGYTEFMLFDPQGPFQFAKVPPDRYQLNVSADNELYLKSITFNEHDASSGILEMHEGKGTLLLDFATGAGGVTGYVDGQSALLPGARVTIAPDGLLRMRWDLVRTVDVDQNGQFKAERLAPGNYRVYVWSAYPGTPLAQMAEFRERFAAQSSQVTIPKGQKVSVTVKPIPAEVIRNVLRTF